MVQEKINKGRYSDHPAGCHSIQSNQCPPPPSPNFYRPDALPAAQPTVSKHWRQLTYASALPGKTEKCENHIFSLKCCISALPEFNQLLLGGLSLFDSRLLITLLYDSLNLVINAFSSGLLGAWFRRKEVERAATVVLCCMHNACVPICCLPERKKCNLWCVWSRLTFAEIVRYPINTVHRLSL